PPPPPPIPVVPIHQPAPAPIPLPPPSPDEPRPVPAFIHRGLDWLAAAQLENGGWGAGSHAHQEITDPQAVVADPATTAFAAMALLRTGSTPASGPYREHVLKAVRFLVEQVEAHPIGHPNITDLTGTQPQSKLGQNIDVSMTAQFLTQVLPHLGGDAVLAGRAQRALGICLNKLSATQAADGSWNDQGGWAAVLQSAMANNAFEMAQEAGMDVDEEALEKSRRYQRSNVDAETGAVRTESAAGISLYSIASNQRATAKDAQEVRQAMEDAKQRGDLAPSAAPSAQSLEQLGYTADKAKELEDAYRQNEATKAMLNDDAVLQGFGNNGGEEFLSYMMTSESLAKSGGEDWSVWYQKMFERLSAVQNGDGSWSGHHCITSPVFCTAAVIMTMLAKNEKLKVKS
ncbi:MAG: hypothetical protein SH809_11150, partial [Rhodothermales bacterium]|nr:hypothetical protein [Rhodothermales bacterium]